MKRATPIGLLLLAASLACGDGSAGDSNLATVRVRVICDNSGRVLPGARVLLVDADTGAPAGPALVADRNGEVSTRVEPGALSLRVEAAGHHPRPLPGAVAVPVPFEAGGNPLRVVQLIRREEGTGRALAGRVVNDQGPLGAALVVAAGPETRSTVTDEGGAFVLFDLPAGEYQVRALLAAHAGDPVAVTVPADADPGPIELHLARGGTGAVEGHVTFLATQNGSVRVTLEDRRSGEAVPGLSAPVEGGLYRIEAVPPGEYVAWAALENEVPVGYVMDPDAVRKFGLPVVTVAAGVRAEQDFDVTGAVALLSPAAPADPLARAAALDAAPTFEWAPYSSADRYFLEVADELGIVYWGGFDGDTPKVELPKTTTRVVYGATGGDAGPLAAGRVYRLRVWAARDDNQDPRGYVIISATEEQRGLFEVGE